MNSQPSGTLTETVPKQFLEKKVNENEERKDGNIKVVKLKPKKEVSWKEDTIDNENMNKLKSNICCIYHKPRQNPDDSSESTCTSDSGNELERSRETKKAHKKKCSKHKGCGNH